LNDVLEHIDAAAEAFDVDELRQCAMDLARHVALQHDMIGQWRAQHEAMYAMFQRAAVLCEQRTAFLVDPAARLN
jgi:hypothetical protein